MIPKVWFAPNCDDTIFWYWELRRGLGMEPEWFCKGDAYLCMPGISGPQCSPHVCSGCFTTKNVIRFWSCWRAGWAFSLYILTVLLFSWLKEHITPSFPSLPPASEIDEMQGSKGHSPCNMPISFEEGIQCDLLLCLPCGYQIMFSSFVLQKEIPLYSPKPPKLACKRPVP